MRAVPSIWLAACRPLARLTQPLRMKPSLRNHTVATLATLALSVLLALPAGAARAETIASKVVQLGEANHVRVSALRAAERHGRLLVQVQFANASSDPQHFAYRFKWLDQDQMSVWEDEAWKPVMLHGLQSTDIQSLAPTRTASDFRIELHAVDNTVSLFGQSR